MTACNGRTMSLENVYVRGGQIKLIILPEILKNAPIFLRVQGRKRARNDSATVSKSTKRNKWKTKTIIAFPIFPANWYSCASFYISCSRDVRLFLEELQYNVWTTQVEVIGKLQSFYYFLDYLSSLRLKLGISMCSDNSILLMPNESITWRHFLCVMELFKRWTSMWVVMYENKVWEVCSCMLEFCYFCNINLESTSTTDPGSVAGSRVTIL